MNQPKRRLKINLTDLESAFESHDGDLEMISYLDLNTGEVVLTTGEQRTLLESVNEEYGDPETREVDWAAVLPELDIPAWQKEALLVADRVEAGIGTLFLTIPQIESREGYNDMVAFIETVADPRLQSRLEQAIHGRGAFRYFKDILLEDPHQRERWFRYRDDRLRSRVLAWLEAEGIEPI